MVETDLGNDAQFRLANVRRIQATTESAFENGIVDLRLGIEEKRYGSQGLEEGQVLHRGRKTRDGRRDFASHTFESLVINRSSVEEEAFVDFH